MSIGTAYRWPELATHRDWLRAEGRRLLDFHRAAVKSSGGFVRLDGDGRAPPDATAETLVTARMTHAFALATLAGHPGAASLARHGVDALRGVLHDDVHGGWLADETVAAQNADKQCYLHLFVALGAATARHAGIDGAHALLTDVLAIIQRYFWSADEQAFVESYDCAWGTCADYRGGNANMHGVEMCLALADVLGEPSWRQRALAVCERLIHGHARACGYHVVEHFDAGWHELRDFNREAPNDGFRPFGVTPGHGCEWARLLLHLEAGLSAAGEAVPDWLVDDARGLFDAAMQDAWAADGYPGLVYTLDWQRCASSSRRRHWVHAEAIAAADALAKRTGEPAYEQWYRDLWDFAETTFIDRERGSWRHELDRHLALDPACGDAKSDLYHAYQATLLPQLPLAPALAVAVGRPAGRTLSW
ncbi:sugar isomerase [Salinisphaera sp. USBA-960]|nr:sugar isomerase [Salifodinibacter halophilus]NNC27102.1 sugar isomerase [Salifodinibacter halophilus]